MEYCCETRKRISDRMQERLEKTKKEHGFPAVPKVVWQDEKCPLCKQKTEVADMLDTLEN